jgi:Eukaryotic protein of unknown function (DUF866)
MVVYVLYIQATLENVAYLALKRNADLCLSVRHPVDHSQVRERIVVDTSAYEPPVTLHSSNNHHHHGSKKNAHPDHEEGECHFAMKWHKDDAARSTIRVIFPSPTTSSSFSDNNDDDEEEQEQTSLERAKSKSTKNKKKQASSAAAANAVVARLKQRLEESNTFVPILALDCQGEIEPFAFHPMGQEFVVMSQFGKTFGSSDDDNDDNAVDLSNGQDWSHVDLATGTTSVSNFQSKFE